jgi:hypothetical protein
MGLTDACHGSKIEVSGTQHREGWAVHVLLDRVADVHLIDRLTGFDKR